MSTNKEGEAKEAMPSDKSLPARDKIETAQDRIITPGPEFEKGLEFADRAIKAYRNALAALARS